MGAEPDVVVYVDAPCGSALLENGDVNAIVQVITANQIGVRGHQDALANADTGGGEDLAVESEVGVVLDDDVAVLATQDRVASDEDTFADDDADVVAPLRGSIDRR
jgi:hypothetical protein